MTVGQLKKELDRYIDDVNIKLVVNKKIKDMDEVSWGVDMSTNKSSVWLCAEREVYEEY